MKISNISIKSLTVTVLILIAFASVLVSVASGKYFFKAAQESQLYSLNRVIQVSTKDIMQELHDNVYNISTALSSKGSIPSEFKKRIKTKKNEGLIEALDDPFVTGFVGAYSVELVKIKAYDLSLDFVAESNRGLSKLPKKMPKPLYQQAQYRRGGERTKALSSLWQHGNASYYSILVPVGGVFVSGYLEIIVNPVISLVKLAEKMDSPVSITSGADENLIYYQPTKSIKELLPVNYILETDMGEAAYHLTSYEDIGKLSEGVEKTVFNSIAMFVGLVLVILAVSAWLFQLFLFQPLSLMLNQIKQISNGDLSRDLNVNGLSEIDLLAVEFTKMVNEVRLREDALKQLSIIDELTKIPNRRKFDETLKNEYFSGCRTKLPLAVLMIDVDYFKDYNDTYGHPEGDSCLKKVAAAIQGSVSRSSDLVARYGGEEFVVVLPDISESGGKAVAKKIMESIDALKIEHSSSKVSTNLTVSVGGYTMVPSVDHSPDCLVSEADKCLYQAKSQGRNMFVLGS